MNDGFLNSYTHQTGNILQQLLMREGLLTIPEPLSALAFDEPVPESRQGKMLNPTIPSKTDIAIIEISTIKEFVFNGFHFQYNHILRHIMDHFNTPEEAKIWLEEIQRDERNQCLINKIVPTRLTPELQDAARNMRVTIQPSESVIADMKKMAAILGIPILWVSHNRLPMDDGSYIAQREVLVNAMRQGAAELGQGFFEPTPYIENFGTEKAMDNVFEYTQEFIAIIGVIYLFSLNEVYDHSLGKPRTLAS